MAYRAPLNQETYNKFEKQSKELMVGLVRIIPLFSAKKGWADTERSLQKLYLHFQHVETPYIYRKPILFRRLALCLNHKEEGIHQTVLDIYERILANLSNAGESVMNDLFFVTMGLFPYLQTHLYQQNKRIYGLVVTHFLPLREQLGPMVPALLSALLPGLIENNQEGEKTVFEIIYALFACLPKPYVYSCLWLVVFRSPAARFGALKFLTFHLGQLQKQNLDLFGDEFDPDKQIVPSALAEELTTPGEFPPPGPQSSDQVSPGLLNSPKFPETSIDEITEVADLERHRPDFAGIKSKKARVPLEVQDSPAPMATPKRGPNEPRASSSQEDCVLQEDPGIDFEEHIRANPQFPSDPNLSRQNPFAQKRDLYPINETMREENLEAAEMAPAEWTSSRPDNRQIQVHENSAFENPLTQEDLSERKEPPSFNPQLSVSADFGLLPTGGQPLEEGLDLEIKSVQETDFNEYNTFREYCGGAYRAWSEYIAKTCVHEPFPHKSTVLEALIACLTDENAVIVQKALDFIILFLPLHSGILSPPEAVTVLQHCLHLLERGEYSIKRRVFRMVFPEFQEDQVDEVLDDSAVQLLVSGMNGLFNKSFESRDIRVFKILQTLFMEREILIEPLITGLAKPILHLISLLPDPVRHEVGSKFFMTISTYYYIFTSAYVDGDAGQLAGPELKVLGEFGIEHIQFDLAAEPPNTRVPTDLLGYHARKLGLELRCKNSGFFSRQGTLVTGGELGKTPLDAFAVFDEEEDELPFEGNNIAHLVRMKLFTGYLRLIDHSPFNSEKAISLLIDLTHEWADLHLNSQLVATSLSLLKKFRDSLEKQELGGIGENAFELILRLSVFLLKRLNENSLINDWAAQLEKFLNKSTDNPVYVLASIRGITELIAVKRSETFRKLNEAAITSAWRLMDDLRFHGPAFLLINELAKLQLDLMLRILQSKMRDEEVVVRVEQLQRIIVFWKVAATQMNLQVFELDEALTAELLDHIEDPHPVLRQLAKSWLFDSSAYLDRILDPIMRKLVLNCRLFVTVTGRAFHVTVFGTPEVMKSFSRLKIAIANNPSKFATFVLGTSPSKTLVDTIRSAEDDDLIRRDNYSDVFLSIGLRYLKAGVLPFMGRRFRQDNLLVSTAACEFLEGFIQLLQSQSPTFLTEALVELLLKAYYQFVADDVSTMQVNMINLLKVILFQSGFLERNKRNLALFERIFREKRLLENVIGSIRNNRNSHTLLKIVDFLDTTIEIFSTGFFPENKLKDVVALIFESYFALIAADEPPVAAQAKFDSLVVLIEAVFKLVHKYFALEDFEVPDKDRPRPWRLLGLLSFGLLGYEKDRRPPPPFRLIEAYFLAYFDKIMIVLLKGWRLRGLTEADYQFLRLGPFGFDLIYHQAKRTEDPDRSVVVPDAPAQNEQGPDPDQPRQKPPPVIYHLPETGGEDGLSDEEEESEEEGNEEAQEKESRASLSLNLHNPQDDQIEIMAEKMYYKYPKEFMESLLKAWVGSFGPVKHDTAFHPVATQSKIIDMISFFNFSVPEFNRLVLDSEVFKEDRLRNKRSRRVALGHAEGSFQCAILALYYGYVKHKKHEFIEDIDLRKAELRRIWHAVCEFLEEFRRATHPQVDLWVINIFHLAARKFPTQEIIGEYAIKRLIHIHENDVLEKVVAFICEDEKTKLPFEKDRGSESYDFVYPFPPLVVDLALREPELYLPKLTASFEEDFHLRYYTKIIALKVLRFLTMDLLKMTYENKTNNRIARRVRNIITRLFNYIESLLRNKLAINENLYVEIIEYLFIFLEDSRDFLMSAFQTPIEKFFDSDLFFECPSRSLVLWAKIIFWQAAAGNRKILTRYIYRCPYQHELLVPVLLRRLGGPDPVQGLPSPLLHPVRPVA